MPRALSLSVRSLFSLYLADLKSLFYIQRLMGNGLEIRMRLIG